MSKELVKEITNEISQEMRLAKLKQVIKNTDQQQISVVSITQLAPLVQVVDQLVSDVEQLQRQVGDVQFQLDRQLAAKNRNVDKEDKALDKLLEVLSGESLVNMANQNGKNARR